MHYFLYSITGILCQTTKTRHTKYENKNKISHDFLLQKNNTFFNPYAFDAIDLKFQHMIFQ